MLSCALALLLVAASTDVDVETRAPPSQTHLRLAFDAGLPGGLALGLQLEPIANLRLSLAALTNVMGFGVRGGVELLPFAVSSLVHPLIGVEAGHHFPGETRRLLKSGPETLEYTFVTGLLGVEAQLRAVTLHAAAGVSGIWARTSGVTFFQRVEVDQLNIESVVFAARLGLSVRLF